MHGLLNIYTVSFFGHREVERFSYIDAQVFSLVRELIMTKEYVDFLIGRNGEFDQIVSSAINRVKRNCRDDNSSHILILPYDSAEYRENEASYRNYYDEIEILTSPDTHYKAAIQRRNRAMVDRSDLVVFYLERESGGAYQTFRYAVGQGKRIVKLNANG